MGNRMSNEIEGGRLQSMSRRGFIGAAGTALAVGALAGTVRARADEAASGLPSAWDYEAEVVICGFGGAGAMAAKEAVACGMSHIVFEKAPEQYAGGTTTCCAGVCNATTNVEALVASSMGYMTEEAAQNLADTEVEVLDWLTASGTVFNGVMADGFGYGLYHSEANASLACGANVLYETAAKQLVYDPVTKEVLGVRAVNAAGEDVYAKATRGVVLATGNFVANEELVHNFMLPREVEYVQLGSPYDEGDALLMGLEIGAATHNLNSFTLELTDMALKKASEEIGVGFDVGATGSYSDSFIYVNQKGQRFMNEGQSLDHFKGTRPWLEYGGIAAGGYTGWTNLPCYVIFDSKLADSSPISTTSSYRMSWAGAQGLHYWSSDNQDEVDRGWLVKADTVEELVAALAEQSGRDAIDAAALAETIEQYNGLCGTIGEEGDAFGRTGFSTIDTPPYYAAEVVTGAVYTMGGLKPGMRCETLALNGEPIPRLYHAGDVGQFMAITSQGTCGAMAAGMIAVRELVSLDPRFIKGDAMTVMPVPTDEQVRMAKEGTGDVVGEAATDEADVAVGLEIANLGEK